MRNKSLKFNMLWNSAGSIYYSVCQWLITVLVARLASSYSAAGVLSVAMSISNIFAQVGLFRIRSYQVSDVREEISSGEYIGFRLTTILLGFSVTIVYMIFSCSPGMYLAILLYTLFRAGDIFIDVLHGIDQQHFRMDYCGKSMIIRGSLFLAAFVAGMMLFDSLEIALFGMILCTYPVIAYDLHAASTFSSCRPVFSHTIYKKLFSVCLPAVIGLALCSLIVTFSRQYLCNVDGESALGIYSTVCTPIVIIQACVNYVYAPLLGVFAKDYQEHRSRDFTNLLLKVLLVVMVFFGICSLLFIIFGNQLFGLVFGPEIAKNCYLIYAGLLASMMTALVAFLSDLLIALREMKNCMLAHAVSFVVSIPLTFYYVDSFGMNGVSFAVSASYSVSLSIMAFFLIRKVRLLK